MAAYFIWNYRITDPEGYAEYGPAIRPTMADSGAEMIVGDLDSESVEGNPGSKTIVLRFESRPAAHRWYDSEAVQSVLHHRLDNTEGIAILCDGFEPPATSSTAS